MSIEETRHRNRLKYLKSHPIASPTPQASLGEQVGDRFRLNYADGGTGYADKLFNGVSVEGDRILALPNTIGRISVLGENATRTEPETLASPLKGGLLVDRNDIETAIAPPSLRNRQGFLRGQIFVDEELLTGLNWLYAVENGAFISPQRNAAKFTYSDRFGLIGQNGDHQTGIALGLLSLPSRAQIKLSAAGLTPASAAFGYNNLTVGVIRGRQLEGRLIATIADLIATLPDPSNPSPLYRLSQSDPFTDRLYSQQAQSDDPKSTITNVTVNGTDGDGAPLPFSLTQISFSTTIDLPKGNHAIVFISSKRTDPEDIFLHPPAVFWNINTQVR